ncbi:MAG: hypothetical protein GY715_08050 [Planctomycetes bacterium]|nr:hypothetical protein [Planctomycetota bacterium]
MRQTLAAIAMLALACSGCSSPLLSSTPESRLPDGAGYDLVAGVTVPEVRGVAGCGAQALAAALAREDAAVDPTALAEELPWHDIGATPVDLLLEARRRGADASIHHGSWDDLVAGAHRGETMLVMFDGAVEVRTFTGRIPAARNLHWSVLGGVAHDGSTVLLATTRRRYHVVDREDFLRRWEPASNCLIRIGQGTAASTTSSAH